MQYFSFFSFRPVIIQCFYVNVAYVLYFKWHTYLKFIPISFMAGKKELN